MACTGGTIGEEVGLASSPGRSAQASHPPHRWAVSNLLPARERTVSRRARNKELRTLVFASDTAFEELRERWSALFDESRQPNVFLSWEWCATWWRHFGRGEPHIFCVEEEGRLVGIAPLVLTRDGDGLPVLGLLGDQATTDYADALVHPDYALTFSQLFLEHLRHEFLGRVPVRIDALPGDSVFMRVIKPLAEKWGLGVSTQPLECCPRLALPDDWDSFLSSLDKDDRHELRRKTRRAFSAGRVHHVAYETIEGLSAALQTFYCLHRRSHEDKARFMDRWMQAFFDDLAQAFARRGWLRLAFLQIEGRPVATTMAFQRYDTAYLYNSGFDPEFRHLSVGIVLVGMEIQTAIQRGLRFYDFLRGDEPYKYDFGARDTYIYRLSLSANEDESGFRAEPRRATERHPNEPCGPSLRT